ncbi:MAG TPA: glycosyltransferase family 87 protein [Polyangia bacterium]|nr:glycosyltransferase family 87 protein [Polyangia bacterium]
MKAGGSSPAARRSAFVIALVACWISAGALPLVDMLHDVRAPNDFTPDYVTAVAWARLGRCGRPLPSVLDRATADDYARSIGARRLENLLGPYYVHPPTALLATLPLAPLPYPIAAAIWQLASVGLVGLLAWMLAPIAAEGGLSIPRPLLFLLLLLWPPMLTNLELGQWSPLLAVTLAAGHRDWERGERRRGATWMAVATAIKLSPAVLLLPIGLRDRRAARRFCAVVLALVLLALPMGGLAAWRALLRESGGNTVAWQTWWHNVLSLNGLAARLFGPGRFARPLLAAPSVGRALLLAAEAALVGVAVLALLRRRRGEDDRLRDGCALALWYVLVVVLNPLGWPHYALLLLLPAALTWRAAVALDDPIARRLVALALLLLSIPKETLFLRAIPLPTSPGRSLWLSVPLYAALSLFAAAARIALPRPKPAGEEDPTPQRAGRIGAGSSGRPSTVCERT